MPSNRVRLPRGNTERGLARFLRSETTTGHKETEKMKKLGKSKKEEVDYESLLMDSLPDEIRGRMPFVTFALMGASILMAIIMMCSTGSIEPDAQACVAYGANFRPLTFGGQLWRLFSSAFIHFDIKHLAMNMLCLFSIGCFLEKLIGYGKLFCVYFMTAFTGGMLSMACHADTVCAGASGAVFGLFGAGTMYVLLIWRVYNLNGGHVLGYMKNGLVFIGINFLYGMFPGVDMAAHIGGLVGGLALGAMMAVPILKKDMPHVEWCRRGIALATVFLAAVMLVTVFTGWNANRLDTEALSTEVAKSVVMSQSWGGFGAHQNLLRCAPKHKMVRTKTCCGAHQSIKWCASKPAAVRTRATVIGMYGQGECDISSQRRPCARLPLVVPNFATLPKHSHRHSAVAFGAWRLSGLDHVHRQHRGWRRRYGRYRVHHLLHRLRPCRRNLGLGRQHPFANGQICGR